MLESVSRKRGMVSFDIELEVGCKSEFVQESEYSGRVEIILMLGRLFRFRLDEELAFEAVAFPTVLEYLFSSSYLKGYMYTVAGYDVYLSWVLVGAASSIVITIINYIVVKPSAVVQGVVTCMIAAVGVALFSGSLFSGSIANIEPLFKDGMSGVLAVAVMTPFMYVGFDVIPQAAEEINIPFKK